MIGTGESSEGSDPHNCSVYPRVADRGRPLDGVTCFADARP